MAKLEAEPVERPSPDERALAVRGMFSAIAPRYDLLNHLLSLNIDRRWRQRAAAALVTERGIQGRFLDACAGTLDLALAVARVPHFAGQVVAIDLSLPMLQRGAGKQEGKPITAACADALRLPFGNACFDGATAGFGVRNLVDLDAGLRELARVLKPGARLVVLEFTTPPRQPLRAMYLLYFRVILPWVGRLISRHRSAYAYLPATVLGFPGPGELASRIESAGFKGVRWELLSGGIAALHVAVRH